MRGGLFAFPLYADLQVAAAADARESLHPVTLQPVATTEAFDPQRLAALIRTSSNGLGEPSEISASVLNALPKWAQAVVQSGCFNATGSTKTNKLKRSLEQDEDRPRKRRSMGSNEEQNPPLSDEKSDLQDCLDDLSATYDMEMEEDDVPVLVTQAQRVADSVEKYAELLEQILEKATLRQQNETFERDEMDVFAASDVKTVLQAVRAMQKTDWIRKLDPELLISLMSALDSQVRLGLGLDVQSAINPPNDSGTGKSVGVDNRLVHRLQLSLDAAICELIVMATPQIDRRLLSEESIDNCIQILHHAIRKLLLPCIDTTYVTSVSGLTEKQQTKQHTKRNGSSVCRVNLQVHKSIRKAVDRTIPVVCELIDQLATFMLGVKLADRWVMQLSSSMVELFALEHSSYATSLQRSGLSAIRSIFLKYKPHRELILEGIVGVMIKLPTAKRTLRTVKLQDSGDSVQRVSLLAISTIQSSVPACLDDNVGCDVPHQATGDPASTPDTVSDDKLPQKNDLEELLLDEIRSSAQSFVHVLLKECWKKNEERDYRVIVENFVEDLLVMFVHPEWVGAEDVLQVLSSSLAHTLHAAVAKDAKKPDYQQTLAALNLIGRICAMIKKYQVEAEHSTLENDCASVSIIDEHSKFLRSAILKKKTLVKSSGKVSGVDADPFRVMALKHITVMHLHHHNSEQSGSKKLFLLKFIVSAGVRWSGDNPMIAEREKEIWRSLWDVSKGTASSTFKVASPSADLALKASLHLAVERGFCGMFDKLLAHVLALLSQGVSLQAGVMKALRRIVNIDPMVMAGTGVQLTVRKCCSEGGPSVRSEAVELVGTYVMQQPVLFDKYFDALAERIRDKAISVRKSACKVFKAVVTSMRSDSDDGVQTLRRKSACMRSLVERVGDASEDQHVKNSIIDTFQEVWFGADLSSSRLNDIADGNTLPLGWTRQVTVTDDTPQPESINETKFVSPDGIIVGSAEEAWDVYRKSVIAPASVVKSNRSKEDNTPEVVATIVEVIHGITNLDWFVQLLQRLLEERSVLTKKSGLQSSKDRSAEVKIAQIRSEKIVGGLVNCLMDLQEGTLVEGVSTNERHLQFLSCMKALSAFCEARPLLLSPHLETVRVYLKEEDPKMQSLAVSMINNILCTGKVSERFARMLETDLKTLVLEAPPSVVGPSIKCLANLAAARKKPPVLLFGILDRFFLVLKKYKDKESVAEVSSGDNASLQRALFAAGQIAGATNIDECKALGSEDRVLQIGTVMPTLYDVYANFIRISSNDFCTANAVLGMGFLFPVCPRLFLKAEEDGLLSLLLEKAPVVKLQCLKSIRELLLYEERRLEKGLATQMVESKELQVQGDQEADASLIGNVMQARLDNVLQLLLQKPSPVRMEAIACVGVLLTQGLVNPLQCIPYLVALETDRVVANRDAAHAELLTLYEKFASQFQTPVLKGIRDSYLFQRNCYDHATPFALDKDKKDFCLFGRLYVACVQKSRAQRTLFLKAHVSQFTDKGTILRQSKNNSTDHNSVGFQNDLKYLCYLAQVMAALPYEMEDEPLFLIYSINRYVSLRLGIALDDLKSIFVKAGMPEELLEDESTSVAQANFEDYSLAQLSRPKLAALHTNAGIAFALALVLRLKFHLKKTYRLDNEKCATYRPSHDNNEPAQRSGTLKLLLPSVDDVCHSEDPVNRGWKMFVLAWRAAQQDQKEMDFDAEEEFTSPKKSPTKTPTKRRRRPRRSVATRRQTSEDEEEEYVEGFA